MTLLFLPGMMCDARLFAPQIAVLGNVTVGDLSGADTIAGMAQAVLAAAPARFALAGLSLGGIVAMEIIRQAPERVVKLALMDTNHLAELPEVRAAREPQILAAKTGGLRAVMRDEMKPRYLVDSLSKPAILTLCMDMADTLGPQVFVRQSRALQSRIDSTQTLLRTRLPAMILCGAHDTLCPPERHRQMQELMPNADLHIIQNAGHLPCLEQPDITTNHLKNWLET